MKPLPPGLYEELVTECLREALGALGSRPLDVSDLDPADAAGILADHLRRILRDSLEALPGRGPDRLQAQLELTNEILRLVAGRLADARERGIADVVDPAQLLLAVADRERPGLGADPFPPRPGIPLSQSDLLVNARDECSVGSEIKREIASADRIDLLCSFIKWAGFRLVRDELRAWLQPDRRRRLRVLTTTYIGVTERRVLEELRAMGAEVKVSYDSRRTRLHAKAWLFHRDSGFSTAFIGSSNLSAAAMTDGIEWNVRLSACDAGDILEKFRRTFESYWRDVEFEAFDPERFEAERRRERPELDGAADFVQVDLRPYPFQQDILDRLAVERQRHGRWRNLVVAATGTGKTVIAALDYRRVREQFRQEGRPARLLYIAHRDEILRQSRSTFRMALRDGDFGEILGAGLEPARGEHVFASIMSLKNRLNPGHPRHLGPRDYDIVIMDEVHHAEADTYVRILNHLEPRLLLGLTATPERADGQDIFHWFGQRIAAELRLWDALELGLVAPFHYFGVHDGTDLSGLRWVRGRYDLGQLDRLYTGHHRRAELILRQLQEKVPDLQAMRALGFCAGVDHAEFMARQFSAAGVPAIAISGATPMPERRGALRRLQERSLNVVFTVDLFNEGVDVPEVDTVLFLRPTESATIFLQQLGRGLRRSEGKDCVTVLDFIGHPNRKFRFDRKYRGLVRGGGGGLRKQVKRDFPVLPAGCAIRLDRDSKQEVLDSLASALQGQMLGPVVDELRSLGDVPLRRFLQEMDWSLEDLYRRRDARWTWHGLRRQAGLASPAAGPHETVYAKSLGGLLHADDALRLRAWGELLAGAAAPNVLEMDERSRRLATMLHFLLWGMRRDPGLAGLEQALAQLWRHPAIRQEVVEMLHELEEGAEHLGQPFDLLPEVPLTIHGRYARDEILAAFGDLDVGRPTSLQAGVKWVERHRSDLFFVTIQKSERDYSPRTMYRDGALSPTLFQWDSQNTTGPGTPTGRRYIEHVTRGSHVLLFVRARRRDERGFTCPYTFLGPARYLSHAGQLPMAIQWELAVPIPGWFYPAARLVA